jgi:manganese transport protein
MSPPDVLPLATVAAEEAPRLPRLTERGSVRALLAIVGPAFVASVAYVDPGNFATNFQAGAEHGYLLVWVVVAASAIAILVQYATSKLGLGSQRSLPALARECFPARWNVLLWLQAEVVAAATDVAEFTGAAIGLNLVFGVALLPAGILTGVVALGILSLEQRGYRRFELAIMALLSLVMLGFVFDFLAIGRQSYPGIAAGLLPRLGAGDTLALAVAIIGATVMPHVVYLHSALQVDRIRPADRDEAQTWLRYNRVDCILGLGLAGLVNVAMLCIAVVVLHGGHFSGGAQLSTVHDQLARVAGGGAALVFGVALIASGLSSSSVGTYAGQVVMAGFVRWTVPVYARRIATMLPSFLVLALAANATTALVWSQVVLSFGIPFALVPLAILTCRPDVMGEMVNRPLTAWALWVTTGVVTLLNVWLLFRLAGPLL